jgi:hypothetical protein
MNLFAIILVVVAVISVVLIYIGLRNAEQVDEYETPIPKFQPRQMTDNSVVTEKPKRRYKKRNKKKPTVVNNAPVEKRPVGRPKISK